MTRSIEYTPEDKIEEYIKNDKAVIIPAAYAEKMRQRGRELVERRERINAQKEISPNYLLRRAVALGVIGVTAFIGIHKINDLTYKPNETPRENAITKAYESRKEGAFKILEGKVQVNAGATIRENPFVVDDQDLGTTNRVDAGNILEDYDSEKVLEITNPILQQDPNNPANGIWYGFIVKNGEKSGIYWTNGQNITKRSKDNHVVPYDGKETVGVLSE